jgi:hypothetical protein
MSCDMCAATLFLTKFAIVTIPEASCQENPVQSNKGNFTLAAFRPYLLHGVAAVLWQCLAPQSAVAALQQK